MLAASDMLYLPNCDDGYLLPRDEPEGKDPGNERIRQRQKNPEYFERLTFLNKQNIIL